MTLPPRPLPPAPGHRTRRVYVGYTTHQCLKPHHPHLHAGALALALSRACVPAVCRGVWRAARVPVNAIHTRTRHLGALDSPPTNAHTFSSAGLAAAHAPHPHLRAPPRGAFKALKRTSKTLIPSPVPDPWPHTTTHYTHIAKSPRTLEHSHSRSCHAGTHHTHCSSTDHTPPA